MRPWVGHVANVVQVAAAAVTIIAIVLRSNRFELIIVLALIIVVALLLTVVSLGQTPAWPVWVSRAAVVLLVSASIAYGSFLHVYVEDSESSSLGAQPGAVPQVTSAPGPELTPRSRGQITFPADGETVRDCKTVKGTSDPGQEIWIVLVAPAGSSSYYPQDGPSEVPGGGEWSAEACFGSEGGFEILAVAAGPGTRAAFAVYREMCHALKQCLPVAQFWEDDAVIDEISVTAEKPTRQAGSPPVPAASAHITPKPDRAPPGGPFAVTGEHFTAGELVTIYLQDETLGVGGKYQLGNMPVHEDGTFAINVSIPADASINPGHVYRIMAIGADSGRSDIQAFDVI